MQTSSTALPDDKAIMRIKLLVRGERQGSKTYKQMKAPLLAVRWRRASGARKVYHTKPQSFKGNKGENLATAAGARHVAPQRQHC